MCLRPFTTNLFRPKLALPLGLTLHFTMQIFYQMVTDKLIWNKQLADIWAESG